LFFGTTCHKLPQSATIICGKLWPVVASCGHFVVWCGVVWCAEIVESCGSTVGSCGCSVGSCGCSVGSCGPYCGELWATMGHNKSPTLKVPYCGWNSHNSPQLATTRPQLATIIVASCGGLWGDQNQWG
jgi:hypothetical protein